MKPLTLYCHHLHTRLWVPGGRDSWSSHLYPQHPGLARGWATQWMDPFALHVSSQFTKPNPSLLWSQHLGSFAQAPDGPHCGWWGYRRLHAIIGVALQAHLAYADPQLLGPRAHTQGIAAESRNFKPACRPGNPETFLPLPAPRFSSEKWVQGTAVW